MTETHQITFYPNVGSAIAQFEDVPVEFDVTWEPADRGVGIYRQTASVEFVRMRIGGLEVSRDMLCAMMSRAEVDAIETDVAERIEMGETA